jgi:DNA polymerase-1
MSDKLVLIDGHSILNRAFYGVPDLTNSSGVHTNAVYGFLNIMFKILEEEKPTNFAVAFDVKQPTFRHKMYADYKGTRKGMPDELREQVPLIKEVLEAMNVKIVELAGYEADDVLGTLAKRAEQEGMSVSVITGDRDLLQLATENILIRIPKTKKGTTEVENYYESDVIEKYQVTPQEFIDVKALMGDTADNIPGVVSVGEKTATSLIVEYHSIENLYEHIDDVTKKKLKENLQNNRDIAFMSKALATINTDSPVDVDIKDTIMGEMYTDKAYELMKKLEFKSIVSRFNAKSGDGTSNIEFKSSIISDFEQADNIFRKAKKQKKLGIKITGNIKTKEIFYVTISLSDKEIYTLKKVWFITDEYIIEKLLEIFNDNNITKCIFGLKEALKYFICYNGYSEDFCNVFDNEIAAYLLNPLKSSYNYDDVARDYLKQTVPSETELFGKYNELEIADKDIDKFIEYVAMSSGIAFMTYECMRDELSATGQLELFNEVEMPLIYSINRMECEGIMVERDELTEYGRVLGEKIDLLEKKIYEQLGREFNINSPKQLGEILFVEMKIPGGKKTKNGYSTSADILEKLAPDYPFIADILEYRQLTKLKSTYADGLVNFISEDNRIHGHFNQTITATGRISSTEPNLQNIPIRMEIGKAFRKVFVPKEGCVFIDADYSQIELRLLAHISGDENLIEAYKSAQDIHRITASKVFNTPLDEVTDEQRSNAKAVNFGIVYGISSFGLSQDLSISRKEAKDYIEQYFRTYPDVKIFLDNVVEKAKKNGYVTTLLGRRRPIPELQSSNFMQRSFGERAAMNSPIQGTAADIIKIAMIKVDKELRKRTLKSKIVLQVHDELLVETYIEEVEVVKEILERNMKNAMNLKVDLEVGIGIGNNWLEAH